MKIHLKTMRLCICCAAITAIGSISEAGGPVGPTFTVGDIPPSLKSLPIPEPPNLMEFVKDRNAAILLGKSFFWDQQTGGDGRVACANCHYHAGADNRIINTRNPAANASFDQIGPGQQLKVQNFPTFMLADPDDRSSDILRNIDDIVGSQGVKKTEFVSIIPGSSMDLGIPVFDSVFNANGVNERRVTGRNTPSVINAVFNRQNFWDGRANHFFNGVSPFGQRDPGAMIWKASPIAGAGSVQETIALANSSAASQAVGPPNNSTEMSFDGRSFPELGAKLLSLRPLAQQVVHPGDSVLGPLAHPSGMGLKTTYSNMIRDAFHERYWDDSAFTPDATPLMLANFSLFWGLAIQMYESTLISNDSPFDQFMDGGGHGGTTDNMLTPKQKLGLDLFRNIGQIPDLPVTHCGACHAHATFSSATLVRIVEIEKANGPILGETPIEMMLMEGAASAGTASWASDLDAPGVGPGVMQLDFEPRGALIEIIQLNFPGAPAVFAGVFPAGPETLVCPSGEIPILLFPTGAGNPNGIEGVLLVEAVLTIDGDCNDEFSVHVEGVLPGPYDIRINGIVKSGIIVADELAFYDQGYYNIGVRDQTEDIGQGGEAPAGQPLSLSRRVRDGFAVPEIDPANNPDIPPSGRIADVGTFKTPILRNVELTGPFFHNGGIASLEDVIKFYDRGGDFHDANITNMHPNIDEIGLTDEQEEAIISFLMALTDERVRWEMAPFDHPSLDLPNGPLKPAVGAGGRAAQGLPPLGTFEQHLLNEVPDAGAPGPGLVTDSSSPQPSGKKVGKSKKPGNSASLQKFRRK